MALYKILTIYNGFMQSFSSFVTYSNQCKNYVLFGLSHSVVIDDNDTIQNILKVQG